MKIYRNTIYKLKERFMAAIEEHKPAEKRRALGRGLDSLLPSGPRVVASASAAAAAPAAVPGGGVGGPGPPLRPPPRPPPFPPPPPAPPRVLGDHPPPGETP